MNASRDGLPDPSAAGDAGDREVCPPPDPDLNHPRDRDARDAEVSRKVTRAVATGLRHRCGVKPGDRLLIAVSGGADSVVLTHVLDQLAQRRAWRLRLAVAHINHRLRPIAETDADAAWVERFADRLGLSCYSAVLDGGRLTRDGNAEQAAREARYAALERFARLHAADAVVTAHHADDQLETVLMRLLRGASAGGLAGLPWRRALDAETSGGPMLIRPMLGLTRAMILRYLALAGLEHRFDETNRDTTRTRAALRQVVLPELRHLQPDAAEKSVAFGEHQRELQAALDWAIDEAERCVVVGPSLLRRAELRRTPRAVRVGLLRRCLMRLRVPADRLTRDALLAVDRAVVDGSGRLREFSFAGGVRLVITAAEVRLIARAP